MSAPPPPPPPSRTTAASASSSTSASTSNDSEDSRWKRWGKSAFDKSIVVSDWASGYANSASAKLGGERFWPKSNDFPEEIAKCERILRAFTVEGIEVKPSANANSSGTSTPTGEEAQDANAEGDEKKKDNFVTKKRKVLRKIPPAVIKRAKGIVIYTAMRSGIAPFGGAGGAGLMLARLPDGSWSAPSSITPNNLALGLLLGFDIFDVILIVNTERAMESFKSHKVTLGAETAVAAGPFGTGISGEMGIDRSPVFSYVRSRGLYGGVEAMAQVFLHRFDENERIYYWPGITARDILEGKVRKPPIVDPLYRALRDAETGVAQGDSLDRTVYEPIHAPPNIAVKQLQQEESAELLQDGERLKLPPTPEELEAMEEAGIPDEFDLELERKEKEEAEKRAIEEKREIMALPPPPMHKKVRGYWEARGTKPGEKRRVAPSPLHNQAQIEGDDEKQAQKDDDQLELIDLNDDRPDVKPPLPPRRPAQSVNSLADELEQTGLEPQEEDDFEDAKEIDLPPYEGEERASDLVSTMDSKSRSNRPDNTSPPLPPGVLDRSVSTSEAVPLVVSEPVAHTAGDDAEPKSVLPSDLVAGESISRSNSLSKPSRPPRRAPRTGTPTTPTTPTANITTITTDAPTATSLKLFFDWDETITSSDTLSLIAPAEGEQFHGPPFSSYTDAYLSDLAAFETSFGERNDWTRQLEFLGKIDEVEVASVNRVEEGGLFRDMSKAALLQRAETRVSFREGWDAFYSWLATQTSTDGVAPTTGGGVSADIISVGWSADFIRRAILSRSASSSSSTEHKENKVIEGIYANEVETDPDTHLGTGKLTKSSPLTLLTAPQSELSPTSGIRTGLHKLHIMQSLTQPPPPNNTTERKKQISVYVGDSTTDLPCLVNASFGLIMKKSQEWPGCSINKTIQEVSPPIRKLYENHDEFLKHSDFEDQSEKESENGVLVRVEDWSEALEVIKKIQQQQHTAPES